MASTAGSEVGSTTPRPTPTARAPTTLTTSPAPRWCTSGIGLQFGDVHSRDQAYQLLRGLTYLQTVSGENQGNVVLWMQPDGTLNPSADPPELPDPSDSGASYWLARTIWALGEGYRAFRNEDPEFALFLRVRLELAIEAVDRQVLTPNYGEMQTVDGLQWPSWLIVDGADASSEAIYGLAAYQQAGGSPAGLLALQQLGNGVALMQLGSVGRWPYRAIMPWAQSRSVWHAWGDQMSGALATAGTTLENSRWVSVAQREVGSFTPHLLIQDGPQNGWLPAPADRTQIAYGADATLQNLVRTGQASGRSGFYDSAGIAAAWYFGNNPAGEPMYDPETGRTYDGINPDGVINRNSGAESTIHGLLSMLLLDEYPDIAARAMVAGRKRPSHLGDGRGRGRGTDRSRRGGDAPIRLDRGEPVVGRSLRLARLRRVGRRGGRSRDPRSVLDLRGLRAPADPAPCRGDRLRT